MTNQRELIPATPGELLRCERAQQGLSIELASSQSRIKRSVIEAIESGETGEIPSVYLRGYIRNYARFLGIDTKSLEAQIELIKGAEPEVRTVFTVKSRRNSGEKWLKASSYLVASALIATLAWQFTHEAVRFSQGDSKLSSASGPVPGSGDPAKPDARSSNTHLNASIASVEMLSKRSELASDSAAEQAWAAISGTGEQGAAEASAMHKLSITASADTWVEIADASGNQLELDLIRAGSSREYDGQAPFDVKIGRASAVVLNMDGNTIDLGPYTRGNVARMTLQSQ
jgi:cytoskeleton protein RodZ